MRLTETPPVLESIFIDTSLEIQVTHQIVILGDGEEIASVQDRVLLKPGDDLSGQDERVIALAEAMWTPDALEDYHWGKLNHTRVVEHISINLDNEIKAQVTTFVYRNNSQVAKLPVEIVVKPGDDLTVLEPQLMNVAKLLHTPEVVSKYRAKIELTK